MPETNTLVTSPLKETFVNFKPTGRMVLTAALPAISGSDRRPNIV
jgi:hypothetical protein